jgi:hypothetical protein
MPQAGQGLGEPQSQSACFLASRFNSLHAQKTLQSSMNFPDRLLEILPKYGTLMQGKWNSAETFEYRYDLNEEDGLFGCLARLRTGLFIAGFAIPDAGIMTEEFGNDWIRPNELLTDPKHFSKKN